MLLVALDLIVFAGLVVLWALLPSSHETEVESSHRTAGEAARI